MTALEHARRSRYDGSLGVTEQGPSFGSQATPDDSAAQISHADRKGTRSLTGPQRDNRPQTMTGTSPGLVQGYSFGPYNAQKKQEKR